MAINNQPKIVVTGGGSGGHLNAAISVIDEIKRTQPGLYSNLLYIGGTRGMIKDPTPSIESRKVPELGIRFIGINSGKLHRKFSWYMFQNLLGTIRGFWDAFRLLRSEKPNLIFSTGGYVTVPVVIVGWLLGIKVVIHEQTVVSGLANKIASYFSRRILISFPTSAKYFPQAKTTLTGSPLQKSRFVENIPDTLESAYKEFLLGLMKPSKPLLFVMGGGLGSHKLNQWVEKNLDELTHDYTVLIQTGENQLYNDYDRLSKHNSAVFFAIKWFSQEIGYIFKRAEIVVCRPGANTVLELLAAEKRAVLMPIPWSSANEQQLNAEYFCSHQSGAIVQEKDLDTEMIGKIRQVVKLEIKPTSGIVDRDAANKILQILVSEL